MFLGTKDTKTTWAIIVPIVCFVIIVAGILGYRYVKKRNDEKPFTEIAPENAVVNTAGFSENCERNRKRDESLLAFEPLPSTSRSFGPSNGPPFQPHSLTNRPPLQPPSQPSSSIQSINRSDQSLFPQDLVSVNYRDSLKREQHVDFDDANPKLSEDRVDLSGKDDEDNQHSNNSYVTDPTSQKTDSDHEASKEPIYESIPESSIDNLDKKPKPSDNSIDNEERALSFENPSYVEKDFMWS